MTDTSSVVPGSSWAQVASGLLSGQNPFGQQAQQAPAGGVSSLVNALLSSKQQQANNPTTPTNPAAAVAPAPQQATPSPQSTLTSTQTNTNMAGTPSQQPYNTPQGQSSPYQPVPYLDPAMLALFGAPPSQ